MLEQAGPAELEKCLTTVERLIAAAKEAGHPGEHPLRPVGCIQYSQKLRMELPEAVSSYDRALGNLKPAADSCARGMGLPIPETLPQLRHLDDVAQAFLPWTQMPGSWAREEKIFPYLTAVEEMAEHFLKAHDLRGRLSQTWNAGFFQLDGQALAEEYNTANGKWFLPKLLGINRLVKRMRAYSLASVEKEQLPEIFALLAQYQQEQRSADALFRTYGNGLDHLYTGTNTDWNAVLETAQEAKRSAAELENLTGDYELRMGHGGQKTLYTPITAFSDACKAAFSAREQLDGLLSLADEEAETSWIEEQRNLCKTLTAHAGRLKEWITWNSAAADAKELGLEPVVEAYRGGMPHEQVRSAYLKGMARGLAVRYIDMEEVLSTFSGAVFHEKIAQFRRMDRELTQLTQQEIFCRLAANVPDCAREAAQSSELGILQRAIRSNGRGVSIRRLFEQIPNLLPRLCPCMLMSPISAAQYLDPKREPFDLVVFDEASQLPTSKAVGALARGRNAVVVGDPNQMPPTSFFAANTVDEDNLDTEDLESILDDCLALNMPQTHLLWHYRSRHESLIAFSNRHFYENRLYTFPSVNDRESKVSLVSVEGTFDRGKTRQNRAEAQAVLEELKRRCHDPELSRHSVGVVTFNISQQNLIDDLLTEACSLDQELEQWAYGSEEPVFIKNLENVQGDERDVILFSVGYGADQNGKVSMNFGPLNRAGGWRRLNVAVSRARHEMKVFSSLAPEQINLSRSSAEGVAALQAFLEYAQSGRLDMDEKTLHRVHGTKTGIAKSICAALEDKGYKTQCAVGRSQYKVDIGVVDPQKPDQYLLGILLDGESYSTAKTVRDREIAQIDVLRSLGWNILRIWTMDWWDNRQKELERIVDRLEDLKKQPVKPAYLPEKSTSPQISGEQEAVRRNWTAAEEEQKVAGAIKQEASMSVKTPDPEIPLYEPAVLAEETLSAEDFVRPISTKRILEKICAVVEKEAPVCEPLLTRRVVQSFGIARAGSRIQNRMTQILNNAELNRTQSDGQLVFWKTGQEPESYTGFRASSGEKTKREVRDVPVLEAANAICQVLYDQISLPEDDLIREAARMMGYNRLGSVVTELFRKAILCAKGQGRIEIASNGNWILKPSKKG